MSDIGAAAIGLGLLVLLIFGFWKAIEIVYYLFKRFVRGEKFPKRNDNGRIIEKRLKKRRD